VVGQRAIGASEQWLLRHTFFGRSSNLRLESGSVATGSWIKQMNGTKESIGIFPSTSIVLIDIGKDVTLRAAPETLKEAKNLWGLGVAVGASLTKKCSKSTPFNKCSMLGSNSEKA
jgi:hypothetical protein